MWQKRSEKRSKNMAKPAKAKLFENPIKTVETTVISAGSKLEGRIEAEGNLIIDGSVRGTIKCGA
ncbi:MAG: polymer-forming cytoskeletal protein, partial [Syntrophobacterales bacterium]